MSVLHSNSVDSSASTATMTTISPSDLVNNSANGLYEDRDHFQAIFSNDSRFFDTSLHLFKSYCNLGYIQLQEDKSRKLHLPFLTTSSHGHKHRWRPRLLGSNQESGVLKAFLTPTLLRKSENRSDSGISTNDAIGHQRNSPLVAQYQRSSVPIVSVTDSDECEVIITRL